MGAPGWRFVSEDWFGIAGNLAPVGQRHGKSSPLHPQIRAGSDARKAKTTHSAYGRLHAANATIENVQTASTKPNTST